MTNPASHPPAAALRAAEVAGLLGVSVSTFHRTRRALEGKGFPRALPGLETRWSEAQVRAWIDGGGHVSPPRERPARFVEAARDDLEARYAGGRE